MSAECDKCGTDLQSNSRGMFCPMCEPTAPQTPEAATPRSDSAWNESTYEVENDPKSSWQAVAIRMCHEAQELERELQTVTAELDLANERIDAKQEAYSQCAEQFAATLSELATLRTALATAEARVKQFEKPLSLICECQGSGAGIDEIIYVIQDRIATENAIDPSEFEGADGIADVVKWLLVQRDDFRRQFTEAQAACVEKDAALSAALCFGNDPEGDWGDLSRIIQKALEGDCGTDLLKRLTDAEKEREETDRDLLSCKESIEQIRANFYRLIAERDRLQAEVKELRETLSRIANDDKVSSIHSNPHYNPRCIATQALSDAARTHPKP